MVRVKHILWLFLVSWTLIACQQEKYDRSGDDTNSLLSIEDSMEANPRFVRQKIDDGMKKAPDSLTYYEYMSDWASSSCFLLRRIPCPYTSIRS